ncbi:MAG: heme exporter protein CcmD [Hyphomonadaceae bacterium]
MSAQIGDPHWAYVWPAYAATIACFVGLAIYSVARLVKWSDAAKDDDA